VANLSSNGLIASALAGSVKLASRSGCFFAIIGYWKDLLHTATCLISF